MSGSAGLWPTTREIADRVPVGDRVEPLRDAEWRAAEHAAWRRWAAAAADLSERSRRT